jgi:hypothetical protein
MSIPCKQQEVLMPNKWSNLKFELKSSDEIKRKEGGWAVL